MKLRYLDLFSGIGAFKEGFKRAGLELETIGFSEVDDGYGKTLQKVYKTLHGDVPYLGVVQDISFDKPYNIDILTHGSPCQDFSQAGLMRGADIGSGTKSSLMWETVRIVSEVLPKVVVWENVKGVYFKNNIKNFNQYLSTMEHLGYTNHHTVLKGCDFGVPQKRERMFCVSILGDYNFKFPDELGNNATLHDILESKVDDKYNVPKSMIENWYYKKPPFGNRFNLLKYNDIGFTLVAKGGRAVITNNYILKNQEDYNYINEFKGKPSIKQILEKDLTLRALTPREYWRMQGWSDERIDTAFSIGISDARLYKMAGNSIVVPIIENIARELMKCGIFS